MYTIHKNTPTETVFIKTEQDRTEAIIEAQRLQEDLNRQPYQNAHDYIRFQVRNPEDEVIHQTKSPADIYRMKQEIKAATDARNRRIWDTWIKKND